MNKRKTLKVFEAFSGYGGASYGLKRSGIKYKVIGFSEIEPSADRILHHNFPDIHNYGNIINIREDLENNPNAIPDFDLFTGGFPCQPFSSAGLMQGEKDEKGRGTLIYEIIRICQIKQPEYILLENVRGFLADRFKETRTALQEGLKGYHFRMQVLNSKDYGIPQNRERLWIFASKKDFPIEFSMVPTMPETDRPRLKEFLDKEPPEEVYLSDKQVEHLQVVHGKHGLNSFIVKEPLCLDIYNHKIKTDGLCNTITEPSHNVTRIVEPIGKDGVLRVRKLSINEQFRLMGFKDGEISFPDDLNYREISARAGNGWDVNLVGLLLKHIFSQL
ncbi:MAG: DNA (cytosine-5-)-methyltransferase [Bacteroidales bacterium]|nr:DNA (cytosine-5-)-methyltransferase [Bacteroidales bacterium]